MVILCKSINIKSSTNKSQFTLFYQNVRALNTETNYFFTNALACVPTKQRSFELLESIVPTDKPIQQFFSLTVFCKIITFLKYYVCDFRLDKTCGLEVSSAKKEFLLYKSAQYDDINNYTYYLFL